MRPVSVGPAAQSRTGRPLLPCPGERPRGPEGAAGVVGALDAATRAIAGLQSVDDVLQVIVDQVRPLVGARYAALGIVDADGVIERFITSGIERGDAGARSARCPAATGSSG